MQQAKHQVLVTNAPTLGTRKAGLEGNRQLIWGRPLI